MAGSQQVMLALKAAAAAAAGHRYWRLLVAHTQTDNSVNIAEVELRVAAGGADQTGSGTATGNGTPTGGTPAMVVDNDPATTWHSPIGTMPAWWAYDFGSGVNKAIIEVTIQAHPSNPAYSPQDFDVQYSDDGSAWTTEWSVTGQTAWTNGQIRTFTKGVVAYATLNGTAANVTLSNGNLTATHANTTDNSGARSNSLKNSGKWYFEVTATDLDGNADAIGIVTSAGTFTNVVTNGSNCAVVYRGTGNIWSNGAASGTSLGGIVDGDVICVAVDLDNDKVWFRKGAAGNWNGQAIGSQNPANNTGGANISSYSATTLAPVIAFGGPSTQAGDNMTANFGATAFIGTPPTGFTAGWTA